MTMADPDPDAGPGPAAGDTAPGGDDDPPAAPGAAEPGYAEAVAELDAILAELEGDTVDVDRLAGLVQRGSELISLCRNRILAARMQVERVVADLDRLPGLDAPTGPDDDADDEGSDGDQGLLSQMERRSADN